MKQEVYQWTICDPIGLRLTGNENQINKGVELFLGIHNADSNQIKNTGALSLIRK